MKTKEMINELKNQIEAEGIENLKVVYAEKNDWLLLKTMDRGKTFGAIRFNKNSYVTLYLDTKEYYNMQQVIKNDDTYNKMQADIQSRELGNFIQNKIKFYNKEQSYLVLNLINKVLDGKHMMIEKKERKSQRMAAV